MSSLHLELPFDSLSRLRIHPTQEWHDIYQPENNDDLQRFLDHYLLGKDNGWENTPKVRASLLRFGDRPAIAHRPEDNYPPARTEYHTLYLQSQQGTLTYQKPSEVSTVSYDANRWEAQLCTKVPSSTTPGQPVRYAGSVWGSSHRRKRISRPGIAEQQRDRLP